MKTLRAFAPILVLIIIAAAWAATIAHAQPALFDGESLLRTVNITARLTVAEDGTRTWRSFVTQDTVYQAASGEGATMTASVAAAIAALDTPPAP